MNFDVIDWSPMDKWCVQQFGPEGDVWSIGWETGSWEFKNFEDAMMMELAWVR